MIPYSVKSQGQRHLSGLFSAALVLAGVKTVIHHQHRLGASVRQLVPVVVLFIRRIVKCCTYSNAKTFLHVNYS